MDQGEKEQARRAAKKRTMDRRVKLGFAAVFVLVAGIVLYFQLRGPTLPRDWGDDLGKALAEARQASPPKKVVVFVKGFPASATDSWMIRTTLAKNRKALGPYVKVALTLDADAPWAKKYGVTRTPTMLLISPDGERFHKQAGKIGETDLRDEFLAAPLRKP